MNYRQFMYLSLPDIRNTGRRAKQLAGIPLYRFPKKGGYAEIYEIDDTVHTHKTIIQYYGREYVFLINISTGDTYWDGMTYNTGYSSEIDVLNKTYQRIVNGNS